VTEIWRRLSDYEYWGPNWGNHGFCRVRYPDFSGSSQKKPMASNRWRRRGAAANEPFACEIGLVRDPLRSNRRFPGSYIPLQVKNGNTFGDDLPRQKWHPLQDGGKERTECYVYVFGKKTDGPVTPSSPIRKREPAKKQNTPPSVASTGYRLSVGVRVRHTKGVAAPR